MITLGETEYTSAHIPAASSDLSFQRPPFPYNGPAQRQARQAREEIITLPQG